MTETQEGSHDYPPSGSSGSGTEGWAPPLPPPAMPPPSGPPYQISTGMPSPVPPRTPVKNDGYAVASLVCSLVGIIIGLSAILGIIFGFVARGRIKRSQGTTKGAGMASAGIIVGFVALAISVTIAIVIGLSTTNSANPSSNSATGVSPSSIDIALARSEALAPSDYPSGWHAQGPSSTNPGLSFFAGMNSSDLAQATACLGVSSAGIDTNPAEYAGQTYDDGTGGTLAENVEVFPTSTQAAADLNAFSSSKLGSCTLQSNPGLGASVAKGVGPGATAGTVSTSSKSFTVGGTTVHGVELAIPITYQGTTNIVYIDVVAAHKGRSETVMHFSALGTSPASSLETQMLSAALGKLTT
jgi:Domain of unknown function (DUF4190)